MGSVIAALVAVLMAPAAAMAATGTYTRTYVGTQFQNRNCEPTHLGGAACFQLDGSETRYSVVVRDNSGKRIPLTVVFWIAGASYPEGASGCNKIAGAIPANATDMEVQFGTVGDPTCGGVPTTGKATIRLS